jgi:hypothetical protein
MVDGSTSPRPPTHTHCQCGLYIVVFCTDLRQGRSIFILICTALTFDDTYAFYNSMFEIRAELQTTS